MGSPIDKDGKGVAISGVNWDHEEGADGIFGYSKTYNPITERTITIKTDKPASWLMFGFSAYTLDASVETPMISTIKYYIDDELVKTETFKASIGMTSDYYAGEISVDDY